MREFNERFINALLEQGYERFELELLTNAQIRDLYEEECVEREPITIKQVTSAGGVSTKKVFKEVA